MSFFLLPLHLITKSNFEEALAQYDAIEQELGNPDTYTNPAKFASLESEYKSVQQKLATLNTEYETVFEKVLEMEA